LEEVQRGFTPSVFGAALIASVMADVVSRLANGQQPVYDIPFYAAPPLMTLFLYPVLGGLAGLLSVAFTRGLLLTLDTWGRLRWNPLLIAATVGGLIGGLGIFLPGVISSGDGLIERTLAGDVFLWAIVPFLLLRFTLTLGSYALGTPGGIFAPLLVLGALLGTGMGEVSQNLFPALSINPEALAVVGMAALFTGVVRAPLTGIVLIVEMTGNYGQMLALMLACFSAFAVAEGFKLPPIYDALLARDLRRSPPDDVAESEGGTLLLTLTVQPESPFEGRAVRDLGLPNGCILVTLKRALSEQVVTADTVLEAGDEITALVSPGAKGAVQKLQEGVG
jgi:CIC family chloride channel protein